MIDLNRMTLNTDRNLTILEQQVDSLENIDWTASDRGTIRDREDIHLGEHILVMKELVKMTSMYKRSEISWNTT